MTGQRHGKGALWPGPGSTNVSSLSLWSSKEIIKEVIASGKTFGND